MVYISYSKINKASRSEMSAEGKRLLLLLLEGVGESTDIAVLRCKNGRPYIKGRKDLDFRRQCETVVRIIEPDSNYFSTVSNPPA